MSLVAVSAGPDLPDEIHVVVEIPAQAGPVKYEVEKETGAVFVDRFLGTPMFYPCNYGYVPQTLAGDGDPLDVLVVTPQPLISGTVICARAVGMLTMTDEGGEDVKLIAVPVAKLTPAYDHVEDVDDLPAELLRAIEHFFRHYKDLEDGKWVNIGGWQGVDAAKAEVMRAAAMVDPDIVAMVASARATPDPIPTLRSL